jgi:hypothetical protein
VYSNLIYVHEWVKIYRGNRSVALTVKLPKNPINTEGLLMAVVADVLGLFYSTRTSRSP